MRLLRHIALVIFLFALFGIAVIFTLKNSQVVTIDFGYSLVDGRLAVWLLASLGLGVLLALGALSLVIMRLKARTVLLSRRLKVASREEGERPLPTQVDP